jgi:wyosine [tRNA(Phe)-imidazoG37] synthetase (radical SAM superfamily)
MNYIFGPLNSRRFGLSLGIDAVPAKTCNLNCVYCECGETESFSFKPFEYIKAQYIIDELKQVLDSNIVCDYITFSGAGEPLLNSQIGGIIDFIKDNYPQRKIVILTNGILLSNPEIAQKILKADIIVPSLDASTQDVFSLMTRPGDEIIFDEYIKGLLEFRKIFPGEIFLEIFFVPGINDSYNEIMGLKELCIKISPDKIHLNSLDRPGAVKNLPIMSMEKLTEIAQLFLPLEAEIIGNPNLAITKVRIKDLRESIISIIKRRPSTIEDICRVTGKSEKEVNEIIKDLVKINSIEAKEMERGIFYKIL